MDIRVDDLRGPQIAALLAEHLHNMYEQSPPESVHALGIERLRAPDITMWTAWQDGELLGCAALKELDREHGEVKSMRTASRHLRKGVGSALAARAVGTSWADASLIGILLNTRGLVELVVLNIGLDLGILSPTLFSTMIVMAIVTTVATSPLVTLVRARTGWSRPDQESSVRRVRL